LANVLDDYFKTRSTVTFEPTSTRLLQSTSVRRRGHTGSHMNRTATPRAVIAASTRFVLRLTNFKLSCAFMLLATMIGRATAADELALQPHPGANIVTMDRDQRLPFGLVGTYMLVVAGLLTTTAQTLLGPLMGVSSVLWFIMRNDAAIKPSISWTYVVASASSL